jgi:predicted RNase H-like HicB family nuclease
MKDKHTYLNSKGNLSVMKRRFSVIIEQDQDGIYVGRVPDLKGCLSQGKTLDELMENIKEAVELYLETQGEPNVETRFIGIREIEVA